MLIKRWITIVFILASIVVVAQEKRYFVGTVVDGETMEPLPRAVVITLRKKYIADDNGRVKVPVEVGENIAFTYIGCRLNRMTITDTLLDVPEFKIKMYPEPVMLDEVVARPKPIDLRKLASKVDIVIDENKVRAETNFENAVKIAMTTKMQNADADMATQREMNNHITRQVLGAPEGVSASYPLVCLVKGIAKLVGRRRTADGMRIKSSSNGYYVVRTSKKKKEDVRVIEDQSPQETMAVEVKKNEP